jgi:hypothetical protein
MLLIFYKQISIAYILQTLDSKSQMQHKWEILESTYGTFDQESVHRSVVQIKFERPVPLKVYNRIKICKLEYIYIILIFRIMSVTL